MNEIIVIRISIEEVKVRLNRVDNDNLRLEEVKIAFIWNHPLGFSEIKCGIFSTMFDRFQRRRFKAEKQPIWFCIVLS